MVIRIPKGVYTMKGRLVIINSNAKLYQKGSKKVKKQVLTGTPKIYDFWGPHCWRRYDTEEELRILELLLRLITVRNNLFMPQIKLVRRVRENGHVKRVYELDIPLNRVLKLDEVNAETKAKLVKLRDQ